ncbi:MAG: phosphodiester glycosidase family protein [Bacillota bacterium]|nr:phosphodiester glycosidase family protein [Bacillota bacterium]
MLEQDVSIRRKRSDLNRSKKKKQPLWKKLVIFLAFELIFSTVTMPLIVFYGPFQTVKKTLVGMSWNTLNHQWIAKLFLSDKAIKNILGNSFVVDPVEHGEEIQQLNFAENHSDKIEVFNIDGGNFEGKLMVVHDPTKLVVGYSNKLSSGDDASANLAAGETTSAIAKENGAIAAINAGGFMDAAPSGSNKWTGTGGIPMGFIIHDGKVVFNQYDSEEKKLDTAAFDDMGRLIVGKHSITQLKRLNVKEGVSFGPPLIVNGKPTITQGDGGYGLNPRTAIGQRQDGAVLLLVIDGRSLKSLGASLRDAQDILLKYGAVNAVNLDGGSSTTMYYKGKLINTPCDTLGERTVPTVFMVAPGEGGSGQ